MVRKNLFNDFNDNSNDNNGLRQLSNDDLWNKAKTNDPITRQDIGIQASSSKDGLQILTEGFDWLEN